MIIHSTRLFKGWAAIRGLFSKSSKSEISKEELRDWITAQPDIAEEARKGFEGIEAGRYRKISRRGTI